MRYGDVIHRVAEPISIGFAAIGWSPLVPDRGHRGDVRDLGRVDGQVRQL